ncbi:MAG: FAD-binding oxidoreductase [Ilumatobacteraceae bacterium]
MTQPATEPVRERSLWLAGMPGSLAPRASLEADIEVDVAIVGAGFTGLWTAYYLATLDPGLRIAVVEREVAGFGASGRNGGWVSGFIAGSPSVYAGRGGSDDVLRAERATFAAVDEIGRVTQLEGIDCGFTHDGTLTVAYSEPQRQRLIAGLEGKRARGIREADLRLLEPAELSDLVHTPNALAATFSPHCARVDPARLVRGLATACEHRGVTIYERSPAEISPRLVRTPHGSLRATTVVRATESYSVQSATWRRRFLPLYSLMIATEPLGDDVWAQLGWREGLTISDAHHLFFYAQRTADGRIAIGGRGAPYRLGSPIDQAQERNAAVRARLQSSIRRHFPAAASAAITHHWGGSLAVPRDWCMSVTFDRASGLAWSGGYSGHGVVAANIGGRTLADLILERSTDLTDLPWVGHRPRNWEPEPLRYLASKAIVSVLGSADRREDASGRRARRTRLVTPFVMSR